MARGWTKHNWTLIDAAIREHYPRGGARACLAVLDGDLGEHAIRSRAHKLGVRAPGWRRWRRHSLTGRLRDAQGRLLSTHEGGQGYLPTPAEIEAVKRMMMQDQPLETSSIFP